MDDYETGLQRGRGNGARRTLGRMRWLLVASLFGNVFLFYKAWDYSSQLQELETSNELMRKNVAENNIKVEKSEDFISALHKEKEKCNKYLADTKDLLSECDRNKKECAENLDAISSKLMENAEALRKLEDDKGGVNTLMEKCEEELAALKEVAVKLEAGEMHKSEGASEKQVAEQTNEIKSVEPIQEIKAPESDENLQVNPKEDSHEVESEEKDKHPELLQFASCLFNEDLQQQKCMYRNDPETPTWKLGHAEFLKGANGDQDEKDVLCVYVDDSIISPDTSAGIVFDELKTDRCVEVTLTFIVTDSGSIIVEDRDQSHEFGATDVSGWRTEKFSFQKAPLHLVKFTGKVQSKGGAAIAGISLVEADCAETPKGDDGHEMKNESEDTEELEQLV